VHLGWRFGTTLLIIPIYHTVGLSIILLFHDPALSILLLVKIAEGRFIKAFSSFTNSDSSHFQLPTNSNAHQKQHASTLLSTANFKSPKSAFSTPLM
jgi:hypothetical protein